MNPFPLLLT